MSVKNLTTAAVLSAAFIISSLIFIGLGLGYLGYIDFIVPVFIAIIMLKCDIKYSILSSITSFLLIIFVIGDLSSAVMMVQSMILGIVIGTAIKRGKRIYDDILYCSIFACFLIIIVDINFSVLTGYSLLKECQEYLKYIPTGFEYIKDTVFYITIAILPVGTVILCYLLTLILGKRFKVLNKDGIIKANMIINYKKYGGLISCSRKAIYISLLLFVIFISINNIKFINNVTYLKVICNCESYIIIFFILQDSLGTINKYIFFRTKSRAKMLFGHMIILCLLLNLFKATTIIMIGVSLFLENKYKIKIREESILNKVVDVFL